MEETWVPQEDWIQANQIFLVDTVLQELQKTQWWSTWTTKFSYNKGPLCCKDQLSQKRAMCNNGFLAV